METKELKIGDRVYRKVYNKLTYVYTVQRLTKTMAICENNAKFRIGYTDSKWIHMVGQSGKWFRGVYCLENDELKGEWIKQQLVLKLDNIKFELLPIDKLNKIIDIIENTDK